MSPSQEQVKAWWFDRMSDLAAQNMALMDEVATLRGQLVQPSSASQEPKPKSNGKGAEVRSEV